MFANSLFLCIFAKIDDWNMLATSIFLLPCFVCLVWCLIVFFHRDNVFQHKVLGVLLLVAAVYFYADAYYVTFDLTVTDYKVMVYMDIIAQFITLALPPMLVVYIKVLRNKPINTPITYLSFVPAVLIGCMSSLIYANISVDKAALFIQAFDEAGHTIPAAFDQNIYHVHQWVCNYAYNSLLLVEVILTIVFLLVTVIRNNISFKYLKAFFKGERRVNTLNLVCVLMMLLLIIAAVRIGSGREFLINNIVFSALLSLMMAAIIFTAAYMGTWFSDRSFDSWELKHPSEIPSDTEYATVVDAAMSEDPDYVPDLSEDDADIEDIKSQAAAPVMANSDAKSLTEQFVQYMIGKEPYLNPALSINDVAIALHTNRTYVSTVVNQNFGVSFRDYINVLRVNRAMDLLKKYPEDKLEDIASRSGFASAAQFVRKFREITGETPRAWQIQQ